MPAYSPARRRSLLDKGLCGTCMCRPRLEGRTECSVCLQRRNNYTRHAKPGSWCIDCQACGFHRDGCPAAPGVERRAK
jgi:hypothetical protein